LHEVEQVCERVLILDSGRVVVAGTVDEVTRAVAVQRSGRLRVPPELVQKARGVLEKVAGVSCEVTRERPDVITVRVAGAGDTNTALAAVVAARVPVLAFEVDGARLDDAFLALTRGGPR
jgi:ABC-2 type transport system ATP-binding protein